MTGQALPWARRRVAADTAARCVLIAAAAPSPFPGPSERTFPRSFRLLERERTVVDPGRFRGGKVAWKQPEAAAGAASRGRRGGSGECDPFDNREDPPSPPPTYTLPHTRARVAHTVSHPASLRCAWRTAPRPIPPDDPQRARFTRLLAQARMDGNVRNPECASLVYSEFIRAGWRRRGILRVRAGTRSCWAGPAGELRVIVQD